MRCWPFTLDIWYISFFDKVRIRVRICVYLNENSGKKAADKDKIFRQLFMYLNEKKGGELIISYQLEYYEKNLVNKSI